MISYEHKCIFVHIPKCGGTSIEKLIWPDVEARSTHDLWMGLVTPLANKYQTGGLQHLKAWQIREEVGAEVFAQFFKFALVRNPWDKAVSQFSYIQKRDDLMHYLGLDPADSFKAYLAKIQRVEHVQWMPQYDFVHDAEGNCLIDFVGRLETIEQDTRSILQRIGIAYQSVPHEKKSRRGDYRSYYDAESIGIIESMYGKDIETFGYRFE